MVKFDTQCYTKMGSIVCGAMIVIAAITRLIGISLNVVQQFIVSVHYCIMGITLILSECKFQIVRKNFGLLTEATGRGLYLVFIGTILFDNELSIQLLAALLSVICGFSYIIMDLGDRFKMKYYIEAKQKEEHAARRYEA